MLDGLMLRGAPPAYRAHARRRHRQAFACSVTVIAVLLAASGWAIPGRATADGLCGVLSCGIPTVSAPAVSTDASQTASFSGSVNPNGAATQYWFEIGTSGGETSPQQTLPAGFISTAVSGTIAGLAPGEGYSVTLVAENSYGTITSPPTSFTTPLLPALTATLLAAHTVIRAGEAPGLTAQLGASNAGLLAQLQIAYAPFDSYHASETEYASPTGAVSFGYEAPLFSGLYENASLRVSLTGFTDEGAHVRQPSVGPAIFIDVLPSEQLLVEPVKRTPPGYEGRIRFIDNGNFYFRLQASINPALRHFRSPSIYLYVGKTRGGVFRRIGRTRLVGAGVGQPLAPAQTNSAGYAHDRGLRHWQRAWYLICTATQLAATMGQPFHYPACGRSTVRDNGPTGSETLVRDIPWFNYPNA